MPQGPPATVFAVDDDESFLTAIGRVLRMGGYAVEAVASPTAFLERDPLPVLGCVLVDLQMPDMTGLEFQDRLRTAGWTQPVVFLSGQGTIPATTRALKGGALDFLTKPVRAEDLLRSIGEAVARHATILSTNQELAALRARYAALTPREREVCLGVARGQLNKQIAYDLNLTLATIKFHRARGLIKLGVNSVPELVLLFDRIGVLEAPIGPVSQR
jgi:FixJ family two-component response regulator